MIRIGMIGEYPTDVNCISALLSKKFKDNIEFYTLVYDVHGSNLDNQKVKHQLRREYQYQKANWVIFIRDLDAPESDLEKVKIRKDKFTEFNSVVDKKGILFLNVQELEAILLADFKVLNNKYNIDLEPIEDCMQIPNPKDYIKNKINRYNTGDNAELFSACDYETVLRNCRYFKTFDDNFSRLLNETLI